MAASQWLIYIAVCEQLTTGAALIQLTVAGAVGRATEQAREIERESPNLDECARECIRVIHARERLPVARADNSV